MQEHTRSRTLRVECPRRRRAAVTLALKSRWVQRHASPRKVLTPRRGPKAGQQLQRPLTSSVVPRTDRPHTSPLSLSTPLPRSSASCCSGCSIVCITGSLLPVKNALGAIGPPRNTLLPVQRKRLVRFGTPRRRRLTTTEPKYGEYLPGTTLVRRTTMIPRPPAPSYVGARLLEMTKTPSTYGVPTVTEWRSHPSLLPPVNCFL